MTSLNDLKFHLIRNTEHWDEQLLEARAIANHKAEVVALSHTPRSLGQMNVQILWYLPNANNTTYKVKHFSAKDESFVELIKESLDYLNLYIAPHQLASVSIFEDDHPNDQKLKHVVILHKGNDLTPLVKSEDIKGDLYHSKIYQDTMGWDSLVARICYDIENAGVEENRFGVATTNYTPNDQQVAAVIQWSKVHEDALADNSREGCTCAIF